MKSKLFDVNVYVIDGQVNAIFYKLIYADSLTGDVVQADMDDEAGRFTINIHGQSQEDKEIIRYMLDAEDYDDRPLNEWEEFDEWNTSEWFMQGTAPKKLQEFYAGLEPYEPTLGHLWETVPGTGEHPWSMDALRRCQCGAEYRLERSN